MTLRPPVRPPGASCAPAGLPIQPGLEIITIEPGDSTVGFISGFTPGTIRTQEDMSLALECVFTDLFRDAFSGAGRDDGELDFTPPSGVDGPSFRIKVFDLDERHAAALDHERDVIEAFRRSGLSAALAIGRLKAPGPVVDVPDRD
jgi:hypothetical protein